MSCGDLPVNAYLSAQPSMKRCHAFDQALARSVPAVGLRTIHWRCHPNSAESDYGITDRKLSS
jgi:hypothetical protein